MQPFESQSPNRILALLTFCILAVSSAARADVTITLGGQILRDSSGTALPDGALVMLVSAGIDGSFSFPTGLDFAPGDDVEVARTVVNSGIAGAGSFLDSFSGIEYDNGDATADPGEIAGFLAGQLLTLRWFPTLTIAASTPGFSTQFGNFRFSGTDSANPDPFVAPTDGTAVSFTFLSEEDPFHNLTAADSTAPVPEPGSAILVALAGLSALVRRRR